MANGLFGGGTGTPIDPIIIEDHLDLISVNDASHSYRLKNDIDLAGISMSPSIFGDLPYTGVFDGAGFSIKNWSSTGSESHCSFIGILNAGTVKNLRMENVNLTSTGTNYAAALVSIVTSDSGVISGCSASGSIRNGGLVGGLIAECSRSATIKNCYSTCEVHGDNHTGGFIGYAYFAKISNCYATGNVYGINSVGGFVGDTNASTELLNCYSSGAVHGVSYTGGFSGSAASQKKDRNCYALAPYVQRISGVSTFFGSYCGHSVQPAQSNNCYALTTTEFRSV